MNRFVTVHILTTLGLHNLNRDSNGLPKSQVDGAIQRARMSSQSIKRGARVLYRSTGRAESIRTRLGAYEVVRRAIDIAAQRGVDLDLDKTIDTAVLGVRSLYAGETDGTTLAHNRKKIRALLNAPDNAVAVAEQLDAEAQKEKKSPAKDTIAYLSLAELDAFAESIVRANSSGDAPSQEFVQDSTSSSLAIAAFGRMFAEKQALGTQAAIAVSHSTTVHQMQLVTDYFTAVEDVVNTDAGAAHIGENYFTSGTYYRTFTIDIDQLARSWSGFEGNDAKDSVAALVRSLILALPSGKVNSTNASVLPGLVLAEVQNFRTAYGFETPVEAGDRGGYAECAAVELARQRRQALEFDPSNFGDAAVVGRTFGADFQCQSVADLDALVAFVVDKVYQER